MEEHSGEDPEKAEDEIKSSEEDAVVEEVAHESVAEAGPCAQDFEKGGELFFAEVEPGSSMEEARRYLTETPVGSSEKRGMIKAEPPFFFLMSESTYLEFAVYDLTSVVEPEGEAGTAEEQAMQRRMFGVAMNFQDEDITLWLAAPDEDEKTAWMAALRGIIKVVAEEAETADEVQGMALSWEIDAADLEVGRKIGMGSFGAVHKGLLWGTEVAIKKLKVLNTISIASLKAEVEVLSQLRHPNVVLYIGASTKVPDVFVVMEWCAHGDLECRLRLPSALFNVKNITRFALEIAQGVNYLHSLTPRTIHRDLKAANVFVDANNTMKVGDFGVSAVSRGPDDEGPDEVMGTPRWMAPETWKGSSYDEKVDVWSYGQVLVELITRKEPYHDLVTEEQIIAEIESRQPPHLPDWVPDELRKLVVSCLQYDPTKRPSFHEIIADIRTWFKDLTLAEFYETMDYARLKAFLGSDETHSQLCAALEIAEMESHVNAHEISIYHLPRDDLTWFLGRLTHLLKSDTVSIQQAACKALCAFFERLTQHSATSQDHQKMNRRRNSIIQSLGRRGSMALRCPISMSLSECKSVVGNDSGGLRTLIELLVETKVSHLLPDSRLLGLLPDNFSSYGRLGTASPSKVKLMRAKSRANLKKKGKRQSRKKSRRTASKGGLDKLSATAQHNRRQVKEALPRRASDTDVASRDSLHRARAKLFAEHTPLQREANKLLGLLLGEELVYNTLDEGQLSYLHTLVSFETVRLEAQQTLLLAQMTINKDVTTQIAHLQHSKKLLGMLEAQHSRRLSVTSMIQEEGGTGSPAPLLGGRRRVEANPTTPRSLSKKKQERRSSNKGSTLTTPLEGTEEGSPTRLTRRRSWNPFGKNKAQE